MLLSVVAMPLHLGQSGDCADCCKDGVASIVEAETVNDCCSHDSTQKPARDSEDNRDQKSPCDGCQCPLRCCVSVTPNPLLGSQGEWVEPQLELAGPVSHPGLGLAHSPHLDSIKRPPRA